MLPSHCNANMAGCLGAQACSYPLPLLETANGWRRQRRRRRRCDFRLAHTPYAVASGPLVLHHASPPRLGVARGNPCRSLRRTRRPGLGLLQTVKPQRVDGAHSTHMAWRRGQRRWEGSGRGRRLYGVNRLPAVLFNRRGLTRRGWRAPLVTRDPRAPHAAHLAAPRPVSGGDHSSHAPASSPRRAAGGPPAGSWRPPPGQHAAAQPRRPLGAH